MKQRFVDDVKAQATEIIAACDRLTELNQMKAAFGKGEVATLSLTIGKSVIATIPFSANGKALFANDIFNTMESQGWANIDTALSSIQTILEAESAE